MGRVDGRLCLGLFESAFVAIGNRPIAFPLGTGPFGKEPFDAFPDNLVQSNYGDGYSGYLYLGTLENEITSPLIEGFYSDEFVKELDRRYQLTFNKSLTEGCHLANLDAESFIGWMSNSWGKPREWQGKLGPMDAWKFGDKWEEEIQALKHEYALKHPEIIIAAAKKLLNAIRTADYELHYDGSKWRHFPSESCDYLVANNAPGWVKWVCKSFKDNPIKVIELGKVVKDSAGYPAVPYKLTLTNGEVLEGVLPFKYQALKQGWIGIKGLDWHLQTNSN